MINKVFDITRISRRNFIELLDGLSLNQLNHIPEGFNNNIIWNFGHIVVSQQMLCYMRGGVAAKIDEKFIPRYARGSKPEVFVEQEEIEVLKACAFALTDDLERELETSLFDGYKSFTTHFGVELNHINEAVIYSCNHDNQHLGYAQAIRRLV